MRKLIVFNNISLDGYFVDVKGDMSWANNPNKDAEWNSFVAGNAKGGGVLLFGRITYDLMVSYWPTPLAMKNDPDVAEAMNNLPKVVFSNTMDKVPWKNTKVVNGNIVAEIQKMKRESGPDMAILGSGSIISQLINDDLIDEYQIVVIPVILGKGRTMFEGLINRLRLKLIRSRAFDNGNVLLCYEPVKK